LAELILDFYQKENEYSDGADVEARILDLVRNIPPEAYEKLENAEWPVFYHLSPLRENILNRYPFKRDATILEVGSGSGAITGLLCRRAKSVVSVELTKVRASINFERHKQYLDFKIYVGNLVNPAF